MAKIVCSECLNGPLDGKALFRDKGALFYNGKGIKGVGRLFCAYCAPKKIKTAILASPRCDAQTKSLAVL